MDDMSEAIQAYLDKGGRIRRFEDGASANPIQVLDWIRMQGRFAQYIGHGKAKISKGEIAAGAQPKPKDLMTVDLAGLFDKANEMRRAKGLEPFTIGPSETKAHFCFSTAPRGRANGRAA